MFVIYGFKLRVVINLDLHKFFVEFTFFFNLDEGPIEKIIASWLHVVHETKFFRTFMSFKSNL